MTTLRSALPRSIPVTSKPPLASAAGQLPQRRLRVAAGFYNDQAMAELVRRCLVDEHRLKASQLTLLQPQDADPVRYAAVARRWTLASFSRQQAVDAQRPAWLLRLLAWLPRRRTFDSAVQRRLAAGEFALLAHGISLAQQAAVVRDLRGTAHRWCADAPRLRGSKYRL